MVAFSMVWHRLLELAEAKTDAELGAFLGISQAAVGKQRRKQNIPNTWYDVIRKKTGVTWEELNSGAPPVPAQIAVANGDGNQVANSVHAAPVVSSPGPVVGDIARELCGLIAEHLEGKGIDAQYRFRGRVKKLIEEDGGGAEPVKAAVEGE